MTELIGKIVLSLAGRDKKKYFVAVASDGNYLLISDGKTHKISSPKKKNLKHLKVINDGDINLTKRLKSNKKIYDSELIEILKKQEENRCPKTKI